MLVTPYQKAPLPFSNEMLFYNLPALAKYLYITHVKSIPGEESSANEESNWEVQYHYLGGHSTNILQIAR